MKKNLLLLMLALLLPAFMYGQEQTVSGTVLDTYKMGVPGASIVEKGTTNGTITDFDGNYTLTVSNKNATLVFSFIGYKTQEIPVAGKAKVDVILQENAEQLDEVVVTGYGGSQKRATLTTSISKLDNAVLENAAMANAGQSLQGTVSGFLDRFLRFRFDLDAPSGSCAPFLCSCLSCLGRCSAVSCFPVQRGGNSFSLLLSLFF